MKRYFTTAEIILWSTSVTLVLLSFILFDRNGYLTLTASLIGVTSLIFNAKGNPIGQVLMILFSILYGIISYSFAYYGEMITYLGMTLPMSVMAMVSWLRHPHKGNKAQVEVGSIGRGEIGVMCLLGAAVTVAFYFILQACHTANLIPSTISVTTSFLAVYLTWRRSPYFALAYAANDIILIVLWVMAIIENVSYVSVVVCFVIFLINDLYGFVSWRRMEQKQSREG